MVAAAFPVFQIYTFSIYLFFSCRKISCHWLLLWCLSIPGLNHCTDKTFRKETEGNISTKTHQVQCSKHKPQGISVVGLPLTLEVLSHGAAGKKWGTLSELTWGFGDDFFKEIFVQVRCVKPRSRDCLVGGLKYFYFLPLLGEMIQSD